MHIIDRLTNRVKSMIARGVIRMINDEAGRQLCQVEILKGEIVENVERIQQFGDSSVPPEGSAALIVFVSGDRSRPIIIGDNYVPQRFKNMQSGESVKYDAFDQHIHLKSNGEIEIQTGGTLTVKSADKVRMETERLEVTGDIIDRVDNGGHTMANMRVIYDDHDHDENDGHDHSPTDKPNQKMGGGS